MRNHSQQQRGITLLETMLVSVIASAILILSYQQYRSYKLDSDINQVKYNVDQLFQAASYYYQANCRNQVNSSTGAPIAGSGALDPLNNPVTPTVITPVQLYQAGYLKEMLPWVPSLVYDDGTNTMTGYVVQFNLLTPQQARTINLSGGGTANVGNIYVWRIQVAVYVKPNTTRVGKFTVSTQDQAQKYMSMMGGQCVSQPTGSSVMPCSPTSTMTGDYVVFERLPSFATPSSSSGLYPTNAAIKQFNQQYTTYPILYMTGGSASASSPQNYLCGT